MMKLLKQTMQAFKTYGKVFKRSLITLLLISSFPTLAIGISLYYIGVHQIETEVRQTHMNQFKSILNEIDKKLLSLELIVGRNAFSPVYKDELRNLNSRQHFEDINNIYQLMMLMKDMSPSIKDISVYFNQPGICVSNSKGYITVTDDSEKNWYDSILAQDKGIIWNRIPENDNGNIKSIISLACKIPGNTADPYGVMVISVDIDEIADSVHSLNIVKAGAAFIVDDMDNFIFSEEKQENAVTALRSRLDGENSKNGSFFYTYDGINYSVVYGMIDTTGWKLVTATPLNQLIEPASNTARLIIMVSALGLFAAILLAMFGTIRVWKPIGNLYEYISSQTEEEFCGDEVKYIENRWRQMVDEKHFLSECLEKNYPVLRNGFFLQLMQGHLSSMNEIALREQIKHFGWDVNGKYFLMTGVQISRSTGYAEKIKEDNDRLMTFAASNIIEKIVEDNSMQAHIIDFQNMVIGLMLVFDDNVHINQVKNEVHTVCETIIKHLYEYIGINSTICIGRLSKSLTGVHKEFKDICKALKFRDIKKGNQIIETEAISIKGEDVIRIPVRIEKDIVQALKMGAGQEAVQLIKSFYGEIKQNIGREYLVKQSMLQLLGYIQYELLCSGVDIYSLFEKNLFEQLYYINEPEEISTWYDCKIIRPFTDYFKKTQKAVMKRLVENVIQTIEQHYQTDISLEWCADLHHTYPQELSAAFKVVTGLNYIDYLNKYRIDKSKDMLKNTGKDINGIAKSVGYQPSYFNRVFKRYEGITPGKFRENSRQD